MSISSSRSPRSRWAPRRPAAGYTNETGLTGFLEIGHNNVLGNGQQLSLHLERGGKRVQDYQISFTEPWFHDSPTLLGFSA
jgi:outer membrane protein assembly factor BamA